MANKKQVENKRGVVARRVKGFRDIDPSLNQLKWKIINAASEVYKKYGFEHWDTPVLEYADCLGKYLPDDDTVDKGVYSFKNPEIEPVLRSDGSELRDENAHVVMENQHLSMRYDLTSPLARRYAEGLLQKYQRHMLTQMKPPLFRRYQFGPVYRYEIKLSPGRFREFWQLDFDNVGTNDVAADAEVCMVLSDALEAIGLPRNSYVVKVNNRKILTGYLKDLGVEDDLTEQNIIRVIDKMDKIGLEKVALELGVGRTDESGAEVKGLGLDEKLVLGLTNFIEGFSAKKTRQEVLADLKKLEIQNETAQEGIQEMEKIDTILSALDFDEERVIFDPSLVRGLAYYTGPVYEVESLQSYIDSKGVERRIGSICGGGRYDGLVENLLGIKVPATGASIGVDRLAELLMLTNQAPKKKDGPVFIAFFDEELMPHYQKVARDLRTAGIETEVYYGMDKKKMKKQMAYADDKNCPFVVLIGSNEAEAGIATVKNLKLGKEIADKYTDKKEWMEQVQKEVPIAELASYLNEKMKG